MKKIKIVFLMIICMFLLTGCDLNVENKDNDDIEEDTREIILVTDKWIKRTEERDLYLIGTENEVFKIEDNAFIFKFNSSDLYNQIKIGSKYKIKTTGTRSQLMSWYRNINSIELLEE